MFSIFRTLLYSVFSLDRFQCISIQIQSGHVRLYIKAKWLLVCDLSIHNLRNNSLMSCFMLILTWGRIIFVDI